MENQNINYLNKNFILIAKSSVRILSYLSLIKQTKICNNVDILYNDILEATIDLQNNLSKENMHNDLIKKIIYILAITIDETVLLSEWGKNSIWLSQTICQAIYMETCTAENAYSIIQKAFEDTEQNISFIFITYICLKYFDFNGSYYTDSTEKKTKLLNKLEKIISNYLEKINNLLATAQLNFTNQQKKLQPKKLASSILIEITIILIFLLISLRYINASFFHKTQQIKQLSGDSKIQLIHYNNKHSIKKNKNSKLHIKKQNNKKITIINHDQKQLKTQYGSIFQEIN